MKYLTLCFLIFHCTWLHSQEVQNVNLVKFQKLQCDYSKVMERINDRIIGISRSNDTLLITIGVVDNCCYGDSGSAKLTKDSILLFTHSFSEKSADCNCYFVLSYTLFPVKQEVAEVYYKERSLKLSNRLYLPAEYKNDLLKFDGNAYSYDWTFYESGNLSAVTIRRLGYKEHISFFETGKIKSDIQYFGDLDLNITKEWNEEGKLVSYENNLILDNRNITKEQKLEGGKLLIVKEAWILKE